MCFTVVRFTQFGEVESPPWRRGPVITELR
jgi:hypothetical protein